MPSWALRRKRVPYIPQMQVAECGAACVAMVLAHHGHHAPLAEVRIACGVSRDGANALALVRAARRYGLEARGAKLGVDKLGALPLPAVLHWDFNHFVVLERVTGRYAVLVDPAAGRRKIPLAEVGRHFTGVALLFAPTPTLRPRPAEWPSLGRYVQVFRESWPSFAQVLVASVALQVVGLVFPVANQLLLDRVIGPRQEPWLWGLGLGLAAAVATRALLVMVRSYVVQGLNRHLDDRLMSRFMDHLLRLPLAFFLQRDAGDLMSRVQSNGAVRLALGSQVVSALLDGFLLLGYAGLMLAYHPGLGALVLGLAALRVLTIGLLRSRNRQLLATELAAAGREGAALVEALSGLETTKASGSEARLARRWAHRMTERANANLARRRLGSAGAQVMVLLQGATTASVFLIGGTEVIEQRMTIGVFAAFLALQALFMAPLESLVGAIGELQLLGSHLRRLDDVLETAQEASGTLDPGRLGGGIELKGVQFSHTPGAPPVLRDVNLSVAPGERLAIVGASGAGKSTLARLLLGLHLPDAGTIEFDGRDLRGLDLERVRAQLGVVLQETFLVDDTVRANIGFHDESLPLERIVQAAETACADEFIRALPGGYEARVGENGACLSGGQRQRLSLARALAHDPPILVLDEATSALDLETERKLHGNLAGLRCTRIVIAHRLATIRDADRVVVLKDGTIAQVGTWSELMAVDGPLRELVQAGARDAA